MAVSAARSHTAEATRTDHLGTVGVQYRDGVRALGVSLREVIDVESVARDDSTENGTMMRMSAGKLSQTLHAFFAREGDAWRFYAEGWLPAFLLDKLDEHREAYPVLEPDLEDLERYMWRLDSPYAKQRTQVGGVAIEAKGRAAVTIWEWLDEHLQKR